MTAHADISHRTLAIAARVEAFVRETVIPYEKDPRRDHHGAPTDELVMEMREHARGADVLTPHILADGSHLNQRETAIVLIRSGLSPLGPLACNTMAPDEGNMYLLGREGSPELKERFLKPMVEGRVRSAFFMTEPADDGGAGSDPSMMKTICRRDGNHWVVNGRKTFITGAQGARVGIIMAKAEEGACMFLVDLPDASTMCRTRSTARCPAAMRRSRSTICASPPTRCSGRRVKAFAMRRSASPLPACRIVCGGSARASARTRSPPAMPIAARRSASR